MQTVTKVRYKFCVVFLLYFNSTSIRISPFESKTIRLFPIPHGVSKLAPVYYYYNYYYLPRIVWNFKRSKNRKDSPDFDNFGQNKSQRNDLFKNKHRNTANKYMRTKWAPRRMRRLQPNVGFPRNVPLLKEQDDVKERTAKKINPSKIKERERERERRLAM